MKKKIVVCGGGGFIGGHLVEDLLKQGHRDYFRLVRRQLLQAQRLNRRELSVDFNLRQLTDGKI